MSVSFEQVKNEVRQLDAASKLLGWGALKELPALMLDGEHILRAIQGQYGGHQGWLIATNGRLIFLAKRGFFGSLFQDFRYAKITNIAFKKGVFLGDILIGSSGDDAVISNCSKAEITNFCNFVRQQIDVASTRGVTPVPASTPPEPPVLPTTTSATPNTHSAGGVTPVPTSPPPEPPVLPTTTSVTANSHSVGGVKPSKSGWLGKFAVGCFAAISIAFLLLVVLVIIGSHLHKAPTTSSTINSPSPTTSQTVSSQGSTLVPKINTSPQPTTGLLDYDYPSGGENKNRKHGE